MATAIEKFTAAMNNVSGFWTKTVEVTSQAGDVVLVRCEGFTFKSDDKDRKQNGREENKHE